MTEDKPLERRREILFAYEVKESNPNGDPDMGNLPRMDDQGYNIVTDLRLKRTIRDYWDMVYHGEDGLHILVRQNFDEDGNVMSMEHLVLDAMGESSGIKKSEGPKFREKILKKLPESFIDVRCFGAAVTVKNANTSITGPVQFNLGRSLNKPTVITYPLSTSMSSGEGKGAGTLGDFHVVDYSLILFHGVACEYSATKTGMKKSDLTKVYEGLWYGTKALNTRSKFQQIPRFLISVVSKEEKFQIGDLWRHLSAVKEDEILRIDDVVIDMTALVDRLKEYAEDIESIEYFTDQQTLFKANESESYDLGELLGLTGIKSVDLGF